MTRTTSAQARTIADVALTAALRHQRGGRSIRLGKGDWAQTFDLVKGGMCTRFVRQSIEVGSRIRPWRWEHKGAHAREAEENLLADKRDVRARDACDLLPGDILCINQGSGRYGHIALYVGEHQGIPSIAENTSSSSRGNPRRSGTKITPLSAVAPRITSVGRLQDEQVWRFTVRIDPETGEQLGSGVATTWDDAVTSSMGRGAGVPANIPGVVAASLPTGRGNCKATRGAPFEEYPWYTLVKVWYPNTNLVIYAPLIDEGPGWRAKAGRGKRGSAMVDLTETAKWMLGFPNVAHNGQVHIRVVRDRVWTRQMVLDHAKLYATNMP